MVLSFLRRIRRQSAARAYRKQWQQKNSHNHVVPVGTPDMDKISIGRGTYGPLSVHFSNETNRLVIGNYCSIADNVKFLPSADHALDRISTYPFKALYLTGELEAISKGDIVVDDDVWIGYGATILSGVHIGQGAAIAAGAVVANDVPPYAIVGGVPAKVIKYRFSPEMIQELMKIDYSRLDDALVRSHIEDLYQKLESKEQLRWLPQK